MTLSFNEIVGEVYIKLKDAENKLSKVQLESFERKKQIDRLNDEVKVLKEFLSEKKLLEKYEDEEYFINHSDPELY